MVRQAAPNNNDDFRFWHKTDISCSVSLCWALARTPAIVYVQCQTGRRATLATDDLKKIGFKNPVAVVMNWPEWVQKGNPVEK